MKKTLILLATMVLLVGCVRYDVTMKNGSKVTNVAKPKLDKKTDKYTIKSGGNTIVVPSSKISIIEPHKKEQFKLKGDASDFYIPAR